MGGAIDNGDDGTGTLIVEDSEFAGNYNDSGNGGAIDNGDYGGTGTAMIEDSTFADNDAGYGGAIANAVSDGGTGTLVLVANTFGPNTIGDTASEIANGLNFGTGGSNGVVYSAGNIFDGNCGGDGTAGPDTWYDGGYNVSKKANCLGSSPPTTDAAVSDDVGDLGELASNGGPTQTLLLSAGNPALGLIPTATEVSLDGTDYSLCPTTDQRGTTSPSGAACNAGSVQQTGVTVTVSGSQTYGSSTPSFTYSTSPSGVSVSDLACTTVGSATSISATLDAGSYTILGSSCTGSAASDYDLTFAGATNGFVVAPAPVTVTVSGSQRYGSSSPSFTYTTSPSGIMVSSLSCTTVGSSTSIDPSLATGSYTILGASCTGSANSDYALTFVGAMAGFVVGSESVAVTPVTVTVSGSQRYGSSSPSFTYTTSPSGVTVSGLSCTAVGSSTSIDPSLATGSYTILGSSCTGSAASDYGLTFVGATGGFVVVAAPTTPATPAPPPSGLPSAAFGSPTSAQTSSSSATTLSDSSGSSMITVTVPAGALPGNTELSVYPILASSSTTTAIPTGTSYVAGFGVSWLTPNGTAPQASGPITVTVTDPLIEPGDAVYEVTGNGLVQVAVATAPGTVTFTFLSDPSFIVAGAPKLALASKTVTAHQKTVTVQLSCSSEAPCRGVARASVARKRGHGYTHLVVAQASYTLAAHTTEKVQLSITSTGHKVLKNRKTHPRFRMGLVMVLTTGTREVASIHL